MHLFAAAVPGHDLGDGGDRIEDAAGRLTMDDEDVADAGIVRERAIQGGEVGWGILGRLVHQAGPAGDVHDAPGALAIGAVDEQQELAIARHEAGQHGLDREGSGALHRHGHEAVLAVDDLR